MKEFGAFVTGVIVGGVSVMLLIAQGLHDRKLAVQPEPWKVETVSEPHNVTVTDTKDWVPMPGDSRTLWVQAHVTMDGLEVKQPPIQIYLNCKGPNQHCTCFGERACFVEEHAKP